MLEDAQIRLKEIYQSSRGEVWDRIEDENPEGYLETNVVDGRRRAVTLLLRWMAPLQDRRVLDLGCGRGRLSRQLAEHGARVTAVDLLPRFDSSGPISADNPSFQVGDGFKLAATGMYDDMVIREVLEDYPPQDAHIALEYLAESSVKRVFLIMRVTGPLTRLWNALGARRFDETVDPVNILRWIHLNTPFRLKRQETIQLRNYRVWVVSMVRSAASLDTPLLSSPE